MNWLSFFIGVIVGGGIVYYFWRRKAQEARETERMLRQRLTETESETRRLTAQLDGLKRQEEQFIACQAELQRKNNELQQVTEQSSITESQIRSLRDQLAATGTKGEQLSAAEAQIQTLRDQLAAAEAKAEAVLDRPMPVIAAEAVSAVQRDDLTKIEGIGPKVSQVLNESGILTFAQLAQTEVTRLRAILQDAGPRFRMIEPESWPEQAGLAANGNWDALTKLQDELDGGKYRR